MLNLKYEENENCSARSPTTVTEVQELNVEKYRKADIIEWRADFLGDIESILQAAHFYL